MRKISKNLAALVFGALFTVMQVSAVTVEDYYQEDLLFLENSVSVELEEMYDSDEYYELTYDMTEEEIALWENEEELFNYEAEDDEFMELALDEFAEDEYYDYETELALWENEEDELIAYEMEEEFIEFEYEELFEEVDSDYIAEEEIFEKYM